MADESGDMLRARARMRLSLALAGIIYIVFLSFLVLLARSAERDPLGPLHDVGFMALWVGINFGLALCSVLILGYSRRRERARAAQRGAG
jgi:Zn-dependent protease with chaperone function